MLNVSLGVVSSELGWPVGLQFRVHETLVCAGVEVFEILFSDAASGSSASLSCEAKNTLGLDEEV